MKHNQIRQVVFPILAALIWGTAFVAQDVCADTIGTFTFNAVRYFIAVLALLVLIAVLNATRKDRPQPTEAEKRAGRKQLWLGGFCCGTALAIASNFQQAGIAAGTDAGKAGFLTALYVVLVPVFGLFLGRKGSAQLWASMVIAVVGLYLLCMKNGFGGVETSDWIMFSCAVLFSFQIMSIDHFSPLVDGVRLSLLQFIVVAVESTAAALLFETPTLAEFGANLLPIAYCGVLSSGAGYTLQILGQKNLNPAIASLIMCLESVFSALGGWLLLNQSLSLRESAGCALIFAAVVLSQLPLEELRGCKKGA
jgi:drug/metabolite transporter (DMT)-like permease